MSTLLAAAALVGMSSAGFAHCGHCDKPGDIVQTAVGAGQFSTLATALQEAELVEALQAEGPFTVFAPTDEAFGNLPEGALDDLLADKTALQAVLKYHVVPGRIMAADIEGDPTVETLHGHHIAISSGDGVKVNGATVIQADVAASNGVIHVIDAVLMPNLKDIVDTAAANEDFSTLVQAVQAADLVEALKGDGPFTVFAPIDAAFEKLPEGTLDAVLEDKPKLQAILKYHVVAGKVMSGDVVELETAETLQGQSVTIGTEDGVTIDGAKVIQADIECANGVIHVIDTVILPE